MRADKIFLMALGGVLVAGTEPTCRAYDQATISAYAAGGSNFVEKDAATAPNDLITFTNAVAAAHPQDRGGVFNFPTAVPNPTTLLRGTFGTSQAKRLTLTSSLNLQNITTSAGSFRVLSAANGTTSTSDVPGYTLEVGPVTDAATDATLPEAVSQLGFTVLSRNNAAYPIDVQATATFSDGTTESVTANVGKSSGGDDTFFGFTASSDQHITRVALASFSPGTLSPVSTRIGLDDLVFITKPTVPAPQVFNVSPAPYSVASAAAGLRFEILSFLPVPAGGVTLLLNSNSVTSQLTISGTDADTNRTVTFFGLAKDQFYHAQIGVSTPAGQAGAEWDFNTMESPYVVYDSGGFSDASLYPPGLMQAVATNGWSWLPPADALSVLDTGEAPYGTALMMMQMGDAQAAHLDFPPVSSGHIRVSFDVRVSNPLQRTIDVALQPAGSGVQASYLGWGTVAGYFTYIPGADWVSLAELDAAWHHYDMTNYLSGPAAGTFDIAIDGLLVGARLAFRNLSPPGTPYGRIRLDTRSGGITEYAYVDNLVVAAGPELAALPPPSIVNVSPADLTVSRSSDGFRFGVFSYAPVDTSKITLALNGTDVSAQLTFTGESTNRQVSFTGLGSNQSYDFQIVVTNELGGDTLSGRFFTANPALPVFDSGGFTDSGVYPLGPLQSATIGDCAWIAAASATEIVDSGVTGFGPVLRQTQVAGPEQQTWLTLPTFNGSILQVEFDARVSNPYARTLDLRITSASGATTGPLLAWGVVTNEFGTNSGQLFYQSPASAWVPLLNLDDQWHHYELLSHHAGARSGRFDLTVDGVVVGRSLQAVAPLPSPGRIRFSAIRGVPGDFGEIDNLKLSVGAAVVTPDALTLLNPRAAAGQFSFSFQSQFGVLYDVQSALGLTGGNWTNVTTVLGDGTPKTATSSNPSNSAFYRLSAQ